LINKTDNLTLTLMITFILTYIGHEHFMNKDKKTFDQPRFKKRVLCCLQMYAPVGVRNFEIYLHVDIII